MKTNPFLFSFLRIADLTSGGFQGPIDGGYNSLTDAGTTTLYSLTSKWSEPYFDAMIQKNVTALVGKSAYLSCKVRNLGNKTVSAEHKIIFLLSNGACHLYFLIPSSRKSSVIIL